MRAIRKMTMATEMRQYGGEPSATSGHSLIEALNFYTRFKTREDAWEYFTQWASNVGFDLVVAMPKRFNKTLGWIARMETNGITMKDSDQDKIWNELDNLYSESDSTPTKSKKVKEESLEFASDRVEEIFEASLDEAVDEYMNSNDHKKKMDIAAILHQYKVSEKHYKRIANRVKKLKSELEAFRKSEDIREAYPYLGQRDVNHIVKSLESVCNQLSQMGQRKKRKTKK